MGSGKGEERAAPGKDGVTWRPEQRASRRAGQNNAGPQTIATRNMVIDWCMDLHIAIIARVYLPGPKGQGHVHDG